MKPIILRLSLVTCAAGGKWKNFPQKLQLFEKVVRSVARLWLFASTSGRVAAGGEVE